MAKIQLNRAKGALQFGHGGDAVENAGRLYTGRLTLYALQFGHGGDAVENARYLGEQLGGEDASIRPRR